MSQYKTVIHLCDSDVGKQKSLITQMNNILNANDSIKIELVMHSEGINLMFAENIFDKQLMQLHEKGVRFLVCQNTMSAKNIQPENLLPFCDITDSALVYIIVRQNEGWSYIKAG